VVDQLSDLILEERDLPFDLAVGPLLRAKLVRLADADYRLLLTVHHIIGDDWSMQVFRNELITLYKAFSLGRPSPLPEPVIQFADYASWERSLLENHLLDNQLAYWKKQLTAPLPQLAFHKNGKQKNRLSFYTTRQPIELDETLFASIKDLARKENCTPFMVLISALIILLHLRTGQKDIRIGTLVANRRWKETEGLIGYFLNTVILRVKFSPAMTYSQLLKAVRKQCIRAYAYQDLPFEKLAQVLEQEGSIDRSCLIQVLFNYQNLISESTRAGGINFAPLAWYKSAGISEPMLTTLDLIFNLREMSTTLTGSVNFRSDSFDEPVMIEMLNSFKMILAEAIIKPKQRSYKFLRSSKIAN
jgi:hypothetical protein